MSDPFDAAVSATLQSGAAQIRDNINQALPVNPDAEAQVRQSAATVGVPLATARTMPDQINQQARMATFDPDVLQRQFPTTAQLLHDPDLARITHDDIPGTTNVEAAVKQPAAAGAPHTDPAPGKQFGWMTIPNYLATADGKNGLLPDIGSGIAALTKGLGGSFNKLAEAVNTVIGGAPVLYDKMAGGTAAGDWWFNHAVTPAVNNESAFNLSKDASFSDKGFHATGQLLGTLSQVVLSGGAGEAGAPVVAANDSAAVGVGKLVEHGVKAMTAPALTEAVNTGRDVYTATGDGGAALRAATAAYGTTAAMGVIPVAAEGGLLKRVISGAISGLSTGEASRITMNAALPSDMQVPFDWENAFLSTVTGAALGGVMGGRGEAPSQMSSIRDTYSDAYKSAQAEAQAEQLVQLAKVSNASKLRERDPQAFKQFVANAADGGEMQSVHIEGQAFAQMLEKAGITSDEIRQTMPDVASQLDAALGENAPRNGLVTIPIEDFATHIAGSKIEDAFLQEVRATPESATLGESEALRKSQQDDMQQRAQQIVDTHTDDTVYNASVARMSAQVDMNLAGLKMRPDQLATNSTLLKAFYTTQAANHGVLPHEFAERYSVTGTNRSLAGADEPRTFNQAVHEPETAAQTFVDRSGAKQAVTVSSKTFGADARAPNAVFVEVRDPTTGARRGFADFSIRPDGVLTSENTKVAPDMRGRGIAESMYKAARDAGYDIAPGRVQTDDGLAMVSKLQAKGLINKEADGPRFRAGDLDLVPINGDTLHQKARGEYSPAQKSIALLKDANLSTFQHELGHFFLDTLGHLAAQADAPAQVKADMATILRWGEVSDLDTWHDMSIDQQRELHEKFATGWETYLMKGQAPSLELRGVFARFRAWMLSVYKSLKGAPGDFTPEVRGVFDRMIASEDAIHQAEMARKYMPLFDLPEKSGMTPEEWSAYQAQGKDATEQAIESLIGKTMKDMAKTDRLRTASLRAVQRDAAEKRKALTLEVRREVMGSPVYRAWSFLTGKDSAQLPDEINAEHQQAVRDWSEKREEHLAEIKGAIRSKAWEDAPASKGTYKNYGLAKGQWLAKNRARIDLEVKRQMLDYDAEHKKPTPPIVPDTASKDPTTGAGKIDLDALREAVGKDAAKPLAELRMTTSTGKGMQPGEVADMFGFPDVESLVKAISETEPPRAAVEGLVDQRMLERHGEISSPEAMAKTADELVQNEVRSTFVATELRALKKATGKSKDIVAAAKEAAQNTIDVKRVRDINEGQFRAAETRSATQAERAMMKGDTEGAATAKRDQLLNMELGRAARDAKDFVEKALTYLAKFDKPSVREAIDVDYRDQIDSLLERTDLRKGVSGTALDKRQTLMEWIEKMSAQGYKPDVPENLLNEAQRWHYKDMPFAAFRGLVDSVKSIEQLGKLKEQLRDGQETRRIGELADEMRDTAAKLPQREGESNRGLTRMEEKWVKAKAFGRSAQASLLKMEQMFDWLDARNSNGVMNRVVFRRMSDAGIHENELLRSTKQGIDELMKLHLNDITKTKTIYTADGLIDGATGRPQKFTTKEMLMLAGNAGNESNLGKLAKGEGWDEQAVWDFLHKNMTSAHWDFVEGMGKTLESLWPEKVAMGRRLGETTPEKIAPRAFQTADGKTRSGWYWPLMYDPARSQDVAERGARTGDQLFENIYSKPNSDTGRMNTRNENYARPILLDLDALPKMIKEEIHDIAWREAVIDADRFTSHPVVRKAIIDALGPEHYDQIRPWLQSLANDGKLGVDGNRGWVWLNKIASEARTRATMVGLGYRLTTAAVHGLSAGMESVAELGPVWFGKGLADFSNPLQWKANKEAIFAKSSEMRDRADEVDRDIREHLRSLDTALMDPTSSAMARGANLLRSHAYDLIGGLDMATALPTWQGAYLKGMSPIEKGGLGMSEQDAVYFADKTVRNAHGGTGVKDMAAIQRGSEFQKLFTMFYTFWNHNVNRLIDTGKLIGSAEHRAAMKEANHWSDSQLAATIILRTLVYTIGVQTMHAIFHPPKDGDPDSWLMYAAKEMGSVAFGGIPIARDIYAHYATGRDYSATPAAGIIDTVGKSGTDAAAALTGKQVDDKWVKHLVATAGVVFNLPTGQPANAAQFLWDIGNGTADPTSIKDWFNGLLHGDVKHH
jgi:hypothetical protein